MNSDPNIAVLQYADNNCYVTAVTVEKAKKQHKGFSVDAGKNVWEIGGEKFEIGKRRTSHEIYPCRCGVIGVYRTDEINQLDSMVHAATEAVESRGSILDD